MDVVVTVPKAFLFAGAPGRRGLSAWLAEGDAPGEPWSGRHYVFSTWGPRPRIEPGERVYVTCEDRVVGYAPLVELCFHPHTSQGGAGLVELVRGGGAVACTIDKAVKGFRGWQYRWWDLTDEVPLDLGRWLRGRGRPSRVKGAQP